MGTHYSILAWRITWTEEPGGLQLIAEELMLSNCGDGEDSWESLEDQGVKPVNPKGNQPWTFIEGLMVKLELQYFGHLMWRADSLEKTLSDAGKDWGQEEKWATEDEMVGWHHQLNGEKFEQTLGDGEAQGSLVCFSPWGLKELNMTERLNNKMDQLM